MSRALPPGLGQAFRVAVAELGLCSASWLFVEEIADSEGPDALHALRDELGRDWPVLDAVAAARLEGARWVEPDTAAVLRACGRAERVVVVGLEARWMDALVRSTEVPLSLVRQSVFAPDWERVAANYAGRVEMEPMETFQRLAGPRSVLLTFSYGSDGGTTHVLSSWVRVSGEDVRTQFRALVAWEVLGRPFFVYPRWLVTVPCERFSARVSA